MTPKSKHLLLALAITLVLTAAVVGYYFYRKRASTQAKLGAPSATPEGEQPAGLPVAGGGTSGSKLGGGGLGGLLSGSTSRPVAPSVVSPVVVKAPKSEGASVLTESNSYDTPIRVSIVKDEAPTSGELPVRMPPVLGVDLAPTGMGIVAGDDKYGSVFPLKVGSAGPEVAALQGHLVREYGAQFPEGITSSFDGTTLRAVNKHLHRDAISHAYYNKAIMGRRKQRA